MTTFENMKTLQETMPDLRTVSFISDNAERIYVEKMTMTRSRDRLRIYLHAPFLIQKKDIYAMEAAVKKQYFRSKPVTVEVRERFHLSDQSPREAYQAYRESMLLELKAANLFVYNLFRTSEPEFTESALMLKLPDSDDLVQAAWL